MRARPGSGRGPLAAEEVGGGVPTPGRVRPYSPCVRVALDATALLGRPTGVGVMTRELLRGLGRQPDVDATAFALTWRGRGGLDGQLPFGVRAVRRPMA